jgi:hypothetical protein
MIRPYLLTLGYVDLPTTSGYTLLRQSERKSSHGMRRTTVCQIIGFGPVTQHRLATRAQVQRQRHDGVPAIAAGAHYTLMYIPIRDCELDRLRPPTTTPHFHGTHQ